ncbi:MAG: prolyl oligopeptidase family serine peptidase [Woeseiaceae bacterium]|nr:prolyl oligopeptidase family serine peptidase [Woeseiaceae bacterium]
MTRTAFLVCLWLATGAVAQPLPIEYFVKDGDYLDVYLSPSGNRLAARKRVDDTVILVVVDLEISKLVADLRPRPGDEILTAEWINDERLLYTIAEKRVDFDRPIATGELFGVNYDGTKAEMLAGVRASDARIGSRVQKKQNDLASFYLVNALDNDDKSVLVIEYPWSLDGQFWYDDRQKRPIVSRLNVYSGRKRKVETLPFLDARPYSTRDGDIHFVTYVDEDANWTAAYRENPGADWQPLSEVFDMSEDMTVVSLNEAGDAAFLRGPYGDEGYYTIFRLDFEDRSYEPLFTDLDADIIDWLIDPETGEVAAATSFRGKPRYHYPEIETKSRTSHMKLSRSFEGRFMEIVSATDDGNQLVVRVSSDTNPGEYYFYDNEANKAEFFLANLSWIDPQIMQPMLVDEVVMDDGLIVPVRLTLPDGEGPSPLIVYLHGGPHFVADLWGFDRDVQLLANHGYAVLQVNFRGSGNFGDEFRRAGYREWGGRIIDDIAAATRWARERADIDGDRVCAYGASFGAYASYMLAAREPDLLRCAAGYVGVYDLNMMFSKGDIQKTQRGEAYLNRVLGTDKGLLDAFSPINHADKIEAKTLLIHGDKDRRAPIAHSKAMREALEAAGKTPGWIELDRSGHGAGSLENKMKLYEALLEFLEINLGIASQ